MEAAQLSLVTHKKLWRDFHLDPFDKPGFAPRVDRYRKHTAQYAAKEGRDPFCAVITPDEYAIALNDTLIDEQSGEAAGKRRKLPIGNYVTT